MSDLLLQYELGLLDGEQRRAFESDLFGNPELARRLNTLRQVLRPLDAWSAAEPPPSMVDAIVAKARTTTPLQYVAAGSTIPPEWQRPVAKRPIITLREVVALAACIALFVGVLVPGLARTRNARLQSLCESNLASLGGAFTQYATENDGHLPSIGASKNWLAQPNVTNMAPMLRVRFISPSALVCPTSPVAAPDDDAVMKDPQGFLANPQYRFYSPQNMNGPVPTMRLRVRMPIAADANPLFVNGRYHPPTAHGRDVNSIAHGGRGQNVLFMDGRVQFLPTPVFGPERDNIWLAKNHESYTGTEVPSSATDAFLTP
jgi:hypothetical protein